MGFKENLKAELAYSGILVKELAAQSGVKKHSIDCYLSSREQKPSADAAVKIAKVLGVSVEYLVTGKKSKKVCLREESLIVGQIVDKLSKKNREVIVEFAQWLKSRQ